MDVDLLHSDTLVASEYYEEYEDQSAPKQPRFLLRESCVSNDFAFEHFHREQFKLSVNELIQPNLCLNTTFALPFWWKEPLLCLVPGKILAKTRYLVCLDEIEHHLFPCVVAPDASERVVNVLKNAERKDTKQGVRWWLEMFCCPRRVFRMHPVHRLSYLKRLIQQGIELTGSSSQEVFNVVVDRRSFSVDLVRRYQSVFGSQKRPGKRPSYTILLIDADSPLVMLWQDADNTVSFSLARLCVNSNFYSVCRFVFAVLVYLEQIQISQAGDLLLLRP